MSSRWVEQTLPDDWDEDDDWPWSARDDIDWSQALAEQEAAEEWCDGYDRLFALGVLTREDDHTNTTLMEIRRLLALLGGVA